MGRIKIELPNESFYVEIEGDTPTVKDQIAINKLIRERRRSSSPATQQQISSAEPEQKFDTKSGIQNFKLRSALATAENDEEQVNVLKRFGLSDGDFARDKRGRLAVTKQGGKKLGIDLDQSTLIDEEGLSRYDFSADLLGVAPEIAGGVAGAIAGQVLIPIPIVGAMIGAGVGTGTGKAAEELGETIAGTQAQTFGEVAKDVGKEALIGAAAEGVAGVAFKGITALGRSFSAGKSLTKEELETAGKSIQMGLKPTLSAIRAPSLAARAQAIGEKIFGTSDRLRKNNDVLAQKMAEFRAKFGTAAPDDAGGVLIKGAEDLFASADKATKDAQQSAIKQIDDLMQGLGAAAKKDSNVDNLALDYLTEAFKAMDDISEATFKPIDDVIQASTGKKGFLSTANLKSFLKDLDVEFRVTKKTNPDIEALKSVLKEISKNPIESFTQMYRTRKSLNDLLSLKYGTPSGKVTTTGREQIENAIKLIDNMFMSNNVEASIKAAGRTLNRADKEAIRKAAAELPNARGQYKEFMDKFEDVEQLSVLKNFREEIKAGRTIDADGLAMSFIKDNRPDRLVKLLDVSAEATSLGGRENFRKLLAGNWLRNALSKSNISNAPSGTFNGKSFSNAINDLGDTGKVLFGKNFDQIKKLSDQIGRTSLTNINENTIKQFVQEGADANLVQTLQQVLKTQKELGVLNKATALRNLSEGRLNPTQAAESISSTATTASDVQRMMSYFANDPVATNKIKGYFMNSLIDDFGSTAFTDAKTLRQFADRLTKADAGGKLSAIFGDTVGKEMSEFAQILSFNARTAAGGDLVAANIAASPIQNLGKLAKFVLLGRLLSSGGYYNQIVKQYNQLGAQNKADGLGKIMASVIGKSITQATPQLTQEGINEASRQATAFLENTGISNELSNLQQNISNPNNFSKLSQVNVTQPKQSNLSTNPIVVPDPRTQTLAQRLAQGRN